MEYLFWAHVVIWVFLFVYIFSLVRKTRSLRKELDALRDSRESGEEEPDWRGQGVR